MSLQPEQSARRGRGRVLAVGIAAAVVAAGVALGFVVAPRLSAGPAGPTPGAQTTGAQTTPAPTETAGTASASPTSDPSPSVENRPVPVSAPLAETALVVPMKVRGAWDLYLADVGVNRPVRALIRAPGDDSFPILSLDRRTIIYVHTESGSRELRVAAADGSGDRALFESVPDVCAGRITRPAWNPTDTTVLAVPCISADREYGLYLTYVDGALIRPVDLGGLKVGDPTWSPDGSKLAFWAAPVNPRDGGAIYVANGDGSEAKKVSDGVAGQDADPAWSPDSSTLVFRRKVSDTVMNLYTVPGDGSAKPTVLVAGKGMKSDPSWSPNGERIAFNNTAAYRGKPALTRVWLVDRDGGSPAPLWITAPAVEQEQSTAAWSRR